jgi:hypothetical protein
MTPIRPAMPSSSGTGSSSIQMAQAPQTRPTGRPSDAAAPGPVAGPPQRDNGNRPETLPPRNETPSTPMSVGRFVRGAVATTLGAGGVALAGAGFRAATRAAESNSDTLAPAGLISGGLVAMMMSGAIATVGRSGGATGPEARRALLSEVINIALGMGDVDMSAQIGPHGQRIVDHIQDVNEGLARREVRGAVDGANNDAQAIVTNLLALIQDRGIVSSRASSAMPSAV